MKTRHKKLLAIALAISIAAWLAWTILSGESDLSPQGRRIAPPMEHHAVSV